MNGLGLKELVPGAVAIIGGKIAIVVRHDLNRPRRPICVKTSVNGPEYISAPDRFDAVIGHIDLAEFAKLSKPIIPAASEFVPPPPQREPMWGDGVIPETVKALNLKAGDTIRVRHGRGERVATFDGYNYNRPKYPVSYNINGKRWKGPYSTIVSKVA